MALVISVSIFAKCYSSPAGDSLDISLKVNASCMRVVNTTASCVREDWGLTLKPSAGTNGSSKGIDLMSVQACQMCLDLTLPQSDGCLCSHLMAGLCHLCAYGTDMMVTAGRAGILLLGQVRLLPSLPAPAGTEVLTLGCLFLEYGLKVAKLHHVPDFNTWLFGCWKKKSPFFSLSVLYVVLEKFF